MESVKCPNCNSDRFEARLYYTLNLHTEALKQIPKEERNSIEYLILGGSAPQMVYICKECRYTIKSLADLNILEIKVYIVGNSISKQRQGINYLASLKKFELIPDLGDNGYIKLIGDSWVFTKDAWQKYQQDPSFRLSDSRYNVKIRDLS